MAIDWQATGAMITAGTTVVLAIVTMVYVRLTNKAATAASDAAKQAQRSADAAEESLRIENATRVLVRVTKFPTAVPHTSPTVLALPVYLVNRSMRRTGNLRFDFEGANGKVLPAERAEADRARGAGIVQMYGQFTTSPKHLEPRSNFEGHLQFISTETDLTEFVIGGAKLRVLDEQSATSLVIALPSADEELLSD